MTEKQLREARAQKVAELRKMADTIAAENRSFSDDERKNFDTLEKDIGEIDSRIRDMARVAELERSAPEQRPSADVGRQDVDHRASARNAGRAEDREELRSLALQGWFRRNSAKRMPLTTEQERACELTGLNPDATELVINLAPTQSLQRAARAGWAGGYGQSYSGAEQRALSAVIGALGANTISETLVSSLEMNMLAYGSVMQASDIIRTSSGEPMYWPTVDDTTNTGSQIGEGTEVSTSANPTFGRRSWGAYKFTSNAVLVPYELTEDTTANLSVILGEILGERLGRILNSKCTIGTGAATPMGIVTAAPAATLSTGVATTASATAITWDEIIDFTHSIDPAYRTSGAGFMFSDGIYRYLRTLKDGIGRPLWADGPNATPPATLMGYPYFINQDMSQTITAGAATMLFGKLSMHKIRQVNQVRLYKLSEAYRMSDMDAYVCFTRADSNTLNAGTPPIKKLVQHA